MEKVIFIKYGELTTKKGNRNFFVKTLKNNLEYKLKKYDCTIQMDLSRMYLSFLEKDLDAILEIVKNTFGIHSFHIAYTCPSKMEEIEKSLIETVQQENFQSFKVEVKRSDKNFVMKSDALAPYLGGVLLKEKGGLKVDVHHPEVIVHVEVLKEKTLIFYNAYRGLGGYPVGTQPTGMLMLSGGIDSPVAGYLAMKRGVKIEAVYFEAIPHTSLEAREKVIKLTRKLAKYTKEVKLHIVPFTKIQEEIYKNVKEEYGITIMRRMMYRIMELLAKKQHAYAIVNGESIGQVASQTLKSMSVINEVTSLPVIRPVACLDKLEIIELSKKINTYDISILPYEDCCTVFVPKHPVINPTLEECQRQEANLAFTTLLQKAVEDTFVLKIREDETAQYQAFL